MTIKFYGREKELNLLNNTKKPYLAIIYGRRRIGKTTLALKFVENKDYLYFFVNPYKKENLILEEFSSLLLKKMNMERLKIENWESFFDLLFRYEGFVIFDEFQWFLDINKETPFVLQKYLDKNKEKPTIIITGSVIGMIKKLFIDSQSPLFKRSDIIINLKELKVKDVFKILEDLKIKDLEEKLKFYLLFGGVPYYYNLIYKYNVKNIKEAIKKLIIDEFAPLKNEVRDFIIESFKKEYKTYLSILYAIAEGKTKLEEISSIAQIKTTSLPYYLNDLIELMDIIKKEKIDLKKRKHIYLIKDRYFNFWLKFIYKYGDILNEKELEKIIFSNLNKFFGWSFELLIKELFFSFFSNYQKIFKFYGKTKDKKIIEIDLVAINEKTKEIAFVECKWKDNVNLKEILKELEEKSKYVDWYNEERKENFIIFAKSFNRKIKEYKGKKVHCFDLKEIEKIIFKN